MGERGAGQPVRDVTGVERGQRGAHRLPPEPVAGPVVAEQPAVAGGGPHQLVVADPAHAGPGARDQDGAVGGRGARGVGGPTQVIALQIASNGFQLGQAGYASAMGVVLFFATLVIAAIMLRITRRDQVEY